MTDRSCTIGTSAVPAESDPSERVFKHLAEIQRACTYLYQLEEVAETICENIRHDLGFDFAAIQMIDDNENIIRTICGSGYEHLQAEETWYAIASHSLDGAPDLLDIQADIARSVPLRVEIISGWDERFDRWIYDKFGHKRVTRVFVPIAIVLDKHGSIQIGPFAQCEWKTELQDDGQGNRSLSIRLDESDILYTSGDYSIEVIGTIEAGFYDKDRLFGVPLALRLLSIATAEAQTLRKGSLRFVLELVAHAAKDLVDADCSSLHFPFDGHRDRYVHEIWIGARPPGAERPRKGGLGEQAIREARPKLIPDPSIGQDESYLREFNPIIYASGTRSMAAFPLLLEGRELLSSNPWGDRAKQASSPRDNRARQGVLYVAFNRIHYLSDDEVGWLTHFADRASDAINSSIYYTREREGARRLLNLHRLASSLAHEPDAPGFLQELAGSVANLLAADVVTIYEYSEDEGRFPSAPKIAGRLRVAAAVHGPVRENEAPFLLLKNRMNQYAEVARDDPIFFRASRVSNLKENFVSREKVVSTAGVLLLDFDEVVGVMFVNYRRPHAFPLTERKLIETVASTAAVAIRNRRLLKRREQDILCMTHQMMKNLIAASLTLEDIQHSSLLDGKSEQSVSAFGAVKDQIDMAAMLSSGIYNSLNHEAGRPTKLTDEVRIDGPDEVRRIWDMLQPVFGRDDLTLESSGHQEFPDIYMDRTIFNNVLYSLIENVFKYSELNSRMTLRWTRHSNGDGVLQIQSKGRPILEGERERIFRKFVRGEAHDIADKRRSGVGLGLWIAKELVSLIKGDIWLEVDDDDPEVSTFVVRIPREKMCGNIHAMA